MNRADSATSATLSSLAESIRRAVVGAGAAAYEDAGIQGLCAEGRWEAAVAAMRSVDLAPLIRGAGVDAPPPRSAID
jgi:hypothetical protein